MLPLKPLAYTPRGFTSGNRHDVNAFSILGVAFERWSAISDDECVVNERLEVAVHDEDLLNFLYRSPPYSAATSFYS